MKRYILDKLIEWKNSYNRKPLLIRGPRQVGKTWIMKELGKSYKDGYIYVTLDKNSPYRIAFKTIDPYKIIETLGTMFNKTITEDTLIILDEIQECPDALNSLKYFNEEAKQYHVICAGSLLGLYLNNNGFPVGQVNLMKMGPLSFSEFLLAKGKDKIVTYLNNIDMQTPIPDLIIEDLNKYVKEYIIVGGMPEAVSNFIQTNDFNIVNEKQLEILETYNQDFAKHSDKADIKKINYIWEYLPSQLAKENKKFLYSAIKSGARAREYEQSVIWLNHAYLVNQIFNVNKIGSPLSFYKDLTSFKLYLFDTGLLSCLSHLSYQSVLNNDYLFAEFKGALTENFVLQSLWNKYRDNPYYFSDCVKRQEIDFLIQKENITLPIEVKAGKNKKAISFKTFLNNHDSIPFGIRLSLNPLKFNGRVLNIPLYLIDQVDKIIDINLKSFKK